MKRVNPEFGLDEARLAALLERLPELSLLVVGDFFLDKYLVVDRALSEVSIETGLEAYQVVEQYSSPGAAGTTSGGAATTHPPLSGMPHGEERARGRTT